MNLDIARFEVTGVYTHPDAKADIVLVHGLNGRRLPAPELLQDEKAELTGRSH